MECFLRYLLIDAFSISQLHCLDINGVHMELVNEIGILLNRVLLKAKFYVEVAIS